ncbi:MAG: hypothetical protein HC802_15810 [Caldilineaceae bacterium]|nr:hypothetical protein [Caldilineaceae bacterium]
MAQFSSNPPEADIVSHGDGELPQEEYTPTYQRLAELVPTSARLGFLGIILAVMWWWWPQERATEPPSVASAPAIVAQDTGQANTQRLPSSTRPTCLACKYRPLSKPRRWRRARKTRHPELSR